MNDGRTSREVAVASAGNRLRMVQVEQADQPESVRRKYLDDEVRRALEQILPQDRPAFLESLRSRFPTWESQSDAAASTSVAAKGTQSSFDRAQLNDADFLLEKLANIASSLPEEKKQAVARELGNAGFSIVTRGGPAPEAVAEVKKGLGMTAKDPFEGNRAIELLGVMLQVINDLDEVVWGTWRQLAPPTTTIRRSSDLKKIMSRCVAGDANTPKTVVTPAAEDLRQLIAALTAAIPQAGRAAVAQLKKISPDEVEKVVQTEGGRGWNFEKRCWQKYRDLSDAAEKTVESAVRKSIVDAVTDWIRGPNR